MRGGCYDAVALRARSAYRGNADPTQRSANLGLRLAFSESKSQALRWHLGNLLARFWPRPAQAARKTDTAAVLPVPPAPKPHRSCCAWFLRSAAAFFAVAFVGACLFMIWQGERFFYCVSGLWVSIVFGRYAQKGEVSRLFFTRVFYTSLGIMALDMLVSEIGF